MLRDAMSFTNQGEQDAARLEKAMDDLSWGFEYQEVFSLKKGITLF
jgi:hypothetical protein